MKRTRHYVNGVQDRKKYSPEKDKNAHEMEIDEGKSHEE